LGVRREERRGSSSHPFHENLTSHPHTRPRPLTRASTDNSIVTVQTIGVHRNCFGCGRTCEECRARYMRTCRFCRAEYCVVDNEGSSDIEVCNFLVPGPVSYSFVLVESMDAER
jgi:hypothetical protein